ncbi:21956_t:CDS:2, partial [Gigaspora margarita]
VEGFSCFCDLIMLYYVDTIVKIIQVHQSDKEESNLARVWMIGVYYVEKKENTNQDECTNVENSVKGDFGQLPVVIMYATDSCSHDHISEAAYNQINKAFKLETMQRQAGDSKEQKIFIMTMPFGYLRFGPPVHSSTSAKNAPSEITNGLEPILFLSIRAQMPPSLPTVILLRIDNYT